MNNEQLAQALANALQKLQVSRELHMQIVAMLSANVQATRELQQQIAAIAEAARTKD